MRIRKTGTADLDDILRIHTAAFGQDEEAELVRALLQDPSAQPCLSLLALTDDGAVGHILFTAAQLEDSNVACALLAPLAVEPVAQKQGIGGALIRHGLEHLGSMGVDLIFVLGYPDYYQRHGFEPAGRLGLDACYPIKDEQADAWMVQALRPGVLGTVSGRLKCAHALDRPEYWVE